MNTFAPPASPSSRPAARRPVPNRHVNGQGHNRAPQPTKPH